MNVSWKPKAWIVIILGVVLQSFTFLYLNKPKLFWRYFILSGVVFIIDWKYQTQFAVIFSLICPVHAYFLVRNFEQCGERSWYSKWWGIPVIFAAFFTTILLFRSFAFEPFFFPSASMQPTIDQGNHIIVKKLGFRTYGAYGIALSTKGVAHPDLMQRGNVYAFYPPHKDTPFVKRLMALPGDTIAIRGNDITINGSILATDMLYETDQFAVYEQQLGNSKFLIQRSSTRPGRDMDQIIVPESGYFFMGDNRDNSADSRYWGYVFSDSIIGEVVYVLK